jgi:hypothetical protein
MARENGVCIFGEADAGVAAMTQTYASLRRKQLGWPPEIRCDIYSLGLVLTEMLTGIKNPGSLNPVLLKYKMESLSEPDRVRELLHRSIGRDLGYTNNDFENGNQVADFIEAEFADCL